MAGLGHQQQVAAYNSRWWHGSFLLRNRHKLMTLCCMVDVTPNLIDFQRPRLDFRARSEAANGKTCVQSERRLTPHTKNCAFRLNESRRALSRRQRVSKFFLSPARFQAKPVDLPVNELLPFLHGKLARELRHPGKTHRRARAQADDPLIDLHARCAQPQPGPHIVVEPDAHNQCHIMPKRHAELVIKLNWLTNTEPEYTCAT